MFVTGTDTGVGKTFASCVLLAAWLARGLRASGMKPVASGSEDTPRGLRNEDALALLAASDPAPAYADCNPFAYQPAISLQLHPEFEPAYAIALIESRRGARISHEEAERAIASYQAPDDRARVGGWIRNFLAGATS